jgi:hypothetical protein
MTAILIIWAACAGVNGVYAFLFADEIRVSDIFWPIFLAPLVTFCIVLSILEALYNFIDLDKFLKIVLWKRNK